MKRGSNYSLLTIRETGTKLQETGTVAGGAAVCNTRKRLLQGQGGRSRIYGKRGKEELLRNHPRERSYFIDEGPQTAGGGENFAGEKENVFFLLGEGKKRIVLEGYDGSRKKNYGSRALRLIRREKRKKKEATHALREGKGPLLGWELVR